MGGKRGLDQGDIETHSDSFQAMPSPSAACLAPSLISLALLTHPWGLPDCYLWPLWDQHLPCLLMVWGQEDSTEKRGSQTSTVLLALKLCFMAKLVFSCLLGEG